MCICIYPQGLEDWAESGCFRLDAPTEISLTLRHKIHANQLCFIKIKTALNANGEHACISTISEYPARDRWMLPYRIVNKCFDRSIRVRQDMGTGLLRKPDILRPEEDWITIEPYTEIPYAWSEPQGLKELMVQLAPTHGTTDVQQSSYRLDDVSESNTKQQGLVSADSYINV